MMSLPNEKKWQLYCSQRLQGSTNNAGQSDRTDQNTDGCVQSVWTTGGLSSDPQAYVDKVRLSVGLVSKKIKVTNFAAALIFSTYNLI
jgi:hypothetical protein